MKFEDLGVNPALATTLRGLGFDETFPVQEKTIPKALEGGDIAVRAKTGSGKTLAFGVPMAQMLKREGRIQAMVLVPTRELAIQVSRVLRKISNAYVGLVYGGVGYQKQFDDLKRADIVVGTPGRIIDHLNRGTLRARPRFLVLDEADRMLDMGFIPDVRRIMRACPPDKVWLFSATLGSGVTDLLHGRHFHRIEIGEEMPDLEHEYIETQNKINVLRDILNGDKALIFCNTKHMARRLGGILRMPALHGDMGQAARERNMQQFRRGEKYLIATDVAARGIDIPEVELIVNFDLPKDSQTYIHRSGRTGRAGKKGRVVSFLRGDDHESFRRIIRDLSLDVNRVEIS